MTRVFMFGFLVTCLWALCPPRPARAIVGCAEQCDCKELTAWRGLNAANPTTHGLRKPDPTDPTLSVPAKTALGSTKALGGVYAKMCDAGALTKTGEKYSVVTYTNTGKAVCQIPLSATSGYLEVTLTDDQFNDYAVSDQKLDQEKCVAP